MLRLKSVRQILRVLDKTRSSYKAGSLIRGARRDAVRVVARKDNVTHQTVHDGCCRRLGLDVITDFDVQVQKWLNGNPQLLQERLMSKSDPSCHIEIRQFFGGAGVQVRRNETSDGFRGDEGMETFSVDLPRAKALQLRLLCEIEEKPPSKLIFEIVTTHVERQLKPLLEKIIKDPNNPYEHLRE